jgi:hypothetical protein
MITDKNLESLKHHQLQATFEYITSKKIQQSLAPTLSGVLGKSKIVIKCVV